MNREWVLVLALVPAFLLPGWWTWVALLAIIGFKLWCWHTGGYLWRKTALDWPLLPVALALIIGLAVSLDLRLSLNRAASLLAGIALFYAFANSLTSRQLLKWGAFGLTLLAGGVGLVCLLATDWQQGDILKIPWLYDTIPHLSIGALGSGASAEQEINPRVVGGALAMLLPVVWALALSTLTTRLRKFGLVATALFLTFVGLITQAPTAIGGVLLAAFIFSVGRLIWRRKALLVLTALGITALLLASLPLLNWLTAQLPPPDGEPTRRIIFRIEMWLRSLDMLADKPFTGIGLNNFPLSVNNFYPTYSLGAEAHAHNLWLQTALDGGMLGLAGLLAVIAAVAVTLRRAWLVNSTDKRARALISGIAIGTLAWLFYGVAESITLAHKPAVILWLLWGLAAVLARDYVAPVSVTTTSTSSNNRVLTLRQLIKPALIALSSLLIVGLGVISWNKLNLNLALVGAQKAILSGNALEIAPASLYLQSAINREFSVSAATYDLAARLTIRQGNFALASRYLQIEVREDDQYTTSKYIPAEWGLWQLTTSPAPDPLLRLYNQWQVRYPADALAYARLALTYSQHNNRERSQTILRDGLARTNAPFLNYLLKID